MTQRLLVLGLMIGIGLAWWQPGWPVVRKERMEETREERMGRSGFENIIKQTPEPTPEIEILEPSGRQVLNIPVHYFQTFNNCGPASLAMTLSYFGINKTQQELGQELRPYQNASGDNDDKSVTLEELAAKGEELGLVAFHRPGGGMELLKKLVANEMPVIVRTWTRVNEDIGHYRVVKGFDETGGVIIQDDSLQGKNIEIGYRDFELMWEKFNYEFLVLTRKGQEREAEVILGELADEKRAWQLAAKKAQTQLRNDFGDEVAGFNLAVALYEVGDYQGSVTAFERVENRLAPRTLWYQIEPLLAYRKLERDDELLIRIERILTNGNRAFSELYQLRGEIYLERGERQAAKREFELALRYNENYEPARLALEKINI